MTPDEQDRLLPEQRARVKIDGMLAAAGWVVQDYMAVNLYAGIGVAVRELVTNAGPADYVLFVNRQAVGVIEAKKRGTTLSGVEWQTVKYQANLPDALPAYLLDGRLPYGYESTGDETWFTCRMDPEPTARWVFWFHEPETVMWQIEDHIEHAGGTLRAPIPAMPVLGAESGPATRRPVDGDHQPGVDQPRDAQAASRSRTSSGGAGSGPRRASEDRRRATAAHNVDRAREKADSVAGPVNPRSGVRRQACPAGLQRRASLALPRTHPCRAGAEHLKPEHSSAGVTK